MDEKEIQKLLRLKKFERPSPDYFEGFLKEFHERQRAEMLRTPAWRLGLERLVSLFGHLSYQSMVPVGAAAAVALLAGFLLMGNFSSTQSPTDLASVDTVEPTVHQAFTPTESPGLNGPGSFLVTNFEEPVQTVASSSNRQRHSAPTFYVLDARPVSYEPPFSF